MSSPPRATLGTLNWSLDFCGFGGSFLSFLEILAQGEIWVSMGWVAGHGGQKCHWRFSFFLFLTCWILGMRYESFYIFVVYLTKLFLLGFSTADLLIGSLTRCI